MIELDPVIPIVRTYVRGVRYCHNENDSWVVCEVDKRDPPEIANRISQLPTSSTSASICMFYFFDSIEVRVKEVRVKNPCSKHFEIFTGTPFKESPRYFPGGRIFTLDELLKIKPKESELGEALINHPLWIKTRNDIYVRAVKKDIVI